MTEFEESYTSTPSFQNKHIEHIERLEALLRRQEKALELVQVFIHAHEANPNANLDLENEYKKDIEALRYAITVVKWLNGESGS